MTLLVCHFKGSVFIRAQRSCLFIVGAVHVGMIQIVGDPIHLDNENSNFVKKRDKNMSLLIKSIFPGNNKVPLDGDASLELTCSPWPRLQSNLGAGVVRTKLMQR